MILSCREELQEDEDGLLQGAVEAIINKSKRKRLLDRPTNVRLGMVSFTSGSKFKAVMVLPQIKVITLTVITLVMHLVGKIINNYPKDI